MFVSSVSLKSFSVRHFPSGKFPILCQLVNCLFAVSAHLSIKIVITGAVWGAPSGSNDG